MRTCLVNKLALKTDKHADTLWVSNTKAHTRQEGSSFTQPPCNVLSRPEPSKLDLSIITRAGKHREKLLLRKLVLGLPCGPAVAAAGHTTRHQAWRSPKLSGYNPTSSSASKMHQKIALDMVLVGPKQHLIIRI